MSNPYQTRVQQKVAHCRLLMQALADNVAVEPQAYEALLQSAVVHLAVALRLYLREVAHQLSVKNPERIFQLDDLIEQTSEAAGVEELQEQPWLPILVAAERKVLNPELALGPTTPLLSSQRIAVNAAANSTTTLTADEVQSLLAAFIELVERQRLGFAEY